jgi:molybdate transport system substrate-binding protein
MNVAKRLILGSVLVFALLVAMLVMRSPSNSMNEQDEPIELHMYCAAGVKPPVEEAAREFEAEYGIRINLQFGGSGTLLSNLEVARQGDLYLAADASYTDIALEKGLLRETLPIAFMQPVIAVGKGNPKGITGIDDLLREDVRTALGEPGAASVGKTTKKLLSALGKWEAVEARVRVNGVFKPTVPEVANDVKIGALDAGVVWDATVANYPELEAIVVPEFAAGRKKITVGVLATSTQPTAALRFARFLNSTRGNAIFKRHHYPPVEGDIWELHPEITFFCGAVNRRAVEAVILEFSQREGCTVNTVYNGCGILTGQMRTLAEGDGFPDTYMACDRYYLDTVSDWFQEDVDISEAGIVIVVPKGNPKAITSIADLAKPGVRISVGQPEQCTIGVLTRRLLQAEGVLESVSKNIVSQTASSAMLIPNVTTQSVDAVIAYATDAKAEADKIDVVPIDSRLARAVQPFSIAKTSTHKYLSRRLYAAVANARERFEAAGFTFREQP